MPASALWRTIFFPALVTQCRIFIVVPSRESGAACALTASRVARWDHGRPRRRIGTRADKRSVDGLHKGGRLCTRAARTIAPQGQHLMAHQEALTHGL